eukprot:TRINITY_DN27693_c0_g1_i1.p1 TRINITY_DN27693_c0_g1~~TRINITY_DN27693_c0_g1_i1.p1  ORF type:complete len:151 (+),score=39.93 TRINITY_DN27693_c0_g1_i1:48-500(+)
MVWDEGSFRDAKLRAVQHTSRSPAALMLENTWNRKWHTLIAKGKPLPYSDTRKVASEQGQSVTAVRLFVGNIDKKIQLDRATLDRAGYLGITGYDVGRSTTFTLSTSIDASGVMTMTATDDATGSRLYIGPHQKQTLVRKVFEPTYSTQL